MAKSSINYYLNKKLKSKGNEAGTMAFPVYIRVIHKRILSRIKSIAINVNLTEKEFENLYNTSIKRKVVTEHRAVKVEKGRVTKSNYTVTELIDYDIKRSIESEKLAIQAFFDFAENTVKDFRINNSKTNLGDLLDFFCNLRFWAALGDVESGFISSETRKNMHQKLCEYLRANTDFNAATIEYITPLNIGMHANEPNGERKYISLDIETRKDFHSKGILTDKEAARFEFIELLSRYDFEKYRKPFEKNGGRNPNAREFLTLHVWLLEKSEILEYIAAKGENYTRQNLNETAIAAEQNLIDWFKKGYNEGWQSKNETNPVPG
jgi:hypothetical protein